jgi:hypothetical protein
MLQNKRRVGIFGVALLILLLPLIAMQFTNEVNWSLFDFIIAGVLLFGMGIILDLILSKVNKIGYRISLVIALFILLILIWAELAVGIFGTPFSGN